MSSTANVGLSLPLLAGRNYHCQCGKPVFFRNSQCLACGTPLGYDCERGTLLPLMQGRDAGTWLEWNAAYAPNVAPPVDAQPPDLHSIPNQESSQEFDQSELDKTGSTGNAQQQQQEQSTDPQTSAPLSQSQPQPQPQVLGLPEFQPQMSPPYDVQDFQDVQAVQPVQSFQDQNNFADNNFAPPESALQGFLYKRCQNLSTPASCNWLLSIDDSHAMCRACRLNRTIPDLTNPDQPDNGYFWGLIELAKRRLVSALILLKLPVASRMSEDSQRGLMFDFLRSHNNGLHILTGHDTGLITLNVDEADDVKREAVRKALHEPYRTLLGHFRHEVGHYYWDRLVSYTPWMNGFRNLFGDETQNYAQSLQRNYQQGPPLHWREHFVSAYASAHPWEDWAECWAHYLHMRDTVDTAASFGLTPEHFQLEFTPFDISALWQPGHPEAESFLAFLNHWTRLTTMLNEMSRSMGQPDFYPFVLPLKVVAKLHFIHLLVTAEGGFPPEDLSH